MKVVIIEDEPLASDHLEQMINATREDVEVVAKLDSVEDAVSFYNESGITPDLSFMDIQLSDGLSLDIFRKASVPSPVIFTTAYDTYALDAFKVNSVDYLLKPIDPKELELAIKKYQDIYHQPARFSEGMVETLRSGLFGKYRKRFVIRNGSNFKVRNVDEVAYIRAEGRSVYIYTKPDGRKYLIDHTMEELETSLLNPEKFFRINRQFFVCAENIVEAKSYVNSRLKVILDTPCDYELIVSRERVPHFKTWIAS
ncbi:LytR/AlgR family response regulator transcription factor [Roseivirga sp. BDSF3-8]|uniref:LytR/AlgR family response regulator transcription factor n=1 Tax=Roseivirga sp. BDSF3-8 TaxID=3241598 RepID=UPI003531B895